MRKDIRIVTPLITVGFRGPGTLRELERADLRISHSQVEQGPASIESRFDEALAVPGTIGRIIEAERQGVSAVVVDCLGDPGVAEARECVAIPVLGPCETAMHTAAILGHRFSVVTVFDGAIPVFEALAGRFALKEKLASVRAVDIPVLELEADIERTQAALLEQAKLAIADGAHVLLLGCTGMTGCASAMRTQLLQLGWDVPVLDPLPLAVLAAAALVDAGLAHSRRTYPAPRAKPRHGFDHVPGLQPPSLL